MSDQPPAISVIIPLYNKAPFVARALRSVFAQTVSDYEIIVVDDGSTDGGADVVRAMSDPRIRLFSQPNAGVSAARNRGIAEARASIVAFLDADDEWRPAFLETILDLKKNYPASRVWATSYCFRVPGKPDRPAILRGLSPSPWQGVLEDYFRVAACSNPPICSSAVAIDREALINIGCFPLGIKSGEDLLTWARLVCCYPIAFSSRPEAIFYRPNRPQDRPGRIPDPRDRVGQELVLLSQRLGSKSALCIKEYISMWYKMRTVIYIQLGNFEAARKNIKQSIKYHSTWSVKLVIISLLTYLPPKIGQYLFAILKSFSSIG